MEIHIKHQPLSTITKNEGMWFVEDTETNEILAKLVYHGTEGAITLDSTVVSDKLRGMNVGKRMVNEAATFARAQGIKLIPVCPFVVALFEKVPDYNDVKA